MLDPLVVEPRRSVAPAAKSIASARLVFPAPAGPTSAITRVPLNGCPAMRLSLRAVAGARVALKRGASAPFRKPPPSACFERLARGSVWAPMESVAEQAAMKRGCRADGRSQGTCSEIADGNAVAGVEGHHRPDLQED